MMSRFFVPDHPKISPAIGEFALFEYERLREENKKLLRQVIDLTSQLQEVQAQLAGRSQCPRVIS